MSNQTVYNSVMAIFMTILMTLLVQSFVNESTYVVNGHTLQDQVDLIDYLEDYIQTLEEDHARISLNMLECGCVDSIPDIQYQGY